MNKKMVAAYLSDWALKEFRPGDEKKITHINYSFAKLKDGRVSDEHWVNAKAISELIKANNDITFVISIGGWGAGGFSEAASTEDGRKLFAATSLEIMNKYGFKGIDVDWEYPCRSDAEIASSPDDKRNFTLLLKEVRALLDEQTKDTGEKYLLSIAVGGGEKYTKDIEIEELNIILDYINIMTYDMAVAEQITHHTNLYPSDKYESDVSVSSAVEAFHKAGISKEKLVIGAAFYGHAYEISGVDAKSVLGAKENFKKVEGMGYTFINESHKDGYIRYFDESAKAPYLYNGKKVILLDDPQSLQCKVDYIFSEGLGGIMFWEYNSDHTGILLDALDKAMKG